MKITRNTLASLILLTSSLVQGQGLIHLLTPPRLGLEPAAGLALGFVARGISSKTGFGASEHAFALERSWRGINETLPFDRSFFEDLGEKLIGIDLAIVMWTAVHVAYKQWAKMDQLLKAVQPPIKSSIEAQTRTKKFDLSYMTGMDAWYTYQTMLSFLELQEKYSTRPSLAHYKAEVTDKDAAAAVAVIQDEETWEHLQQRETGTAFTTGMLLSYVNFKLGEYLAARGLGKEWYTEGFRTAALATMIIFQVGFTLNAIARAGYEAWKENTLELCHACKEAYQVGDDLAYVITGAIPGCWTLLRTLYAPKPKTA